MTRIIGGTVGGRRIQTPRGAATRPTSDRVREALFSAIEAWCGSLSGLRFLDLSQRREGDILGAAQHGRRTQLEFLHILEDEDVIAAAREDAFALVADDPELAAHADLAAAVRARVDAEQAAYLERG